MQNPTKLDETIAKQPNNLLSFRGGVEQLVRLLEDDDLTGDENYDDYVSMST